MLLDRVFDQHCVSDNISENSKPKESQIPRDHRGNHKEHVSFNIQSDLVYPNSLVPIIICSDCETESLYRKR